MRPDVISEDASVLVGEGVDGLGPEGLSDLAVVERVQVNHEFPEKLIRDVKLLHSFGGTHVCERIT